MLGPLNVVLKDFGVSVENGFLPDQQPLQKLVDQYYSSWETIAGQLSALLQDQTLRQEVDKLPVLSTSKLSSKREWQRAYVLLSFMTHAYIWGGDQPSQVSSRKLQQV